MKSKNRWLQYQKERFPLLAYIPMMAMDGFSSVSYSMHLDDPRARFSAITVPQALAAVITTLIWFMLMRIADEHKDFEEDAKFRPYRPVPRGLVTLKELRVIGGFLVLVQIALAVWVDTRLLVLLGMGWVWFLLMSFEFFAPKWLKARPTLYLLSHMVIMPFMELYTTAVEWLPRGGGLSIGIALYMISSFCDGTVIEVGRKLRAPENEEYGVDTYTHIWGPRRAMVVWMLCMTISGVSTVIAGFRVRVGVQLLIVLIIMYIAAGYFARRFAKEPSAKNAKIFEVYPGVWMFVMHAMLGFLPFFMG